MDPELSFCRGNPGSGRVSHEGSGQLCGQVELSPPAHPPARWPAPVPQPVGAGGGPGVRPVCAWASRRVQGGGRRRRGQNRGCRPGDHSGAGRPDSPPPGHTEPDRSTPSIQSRCPLPHGLP